MTAPDPNTNASLLLRVRDPGDSDAWRLFVEVYGPLIENSCRRRGLQPADAADVGQNVVARVSAAIRKFDYSVERGRFRAWLGAIIRNEIQRHWARQRRQPDMIGDNTLDIATAETDPAWREEYVTHVVRVACDRIHREFETSSWQAFEATWFRGEDPALVASRLGLSLRAVYVAKSRIAGRLRLEILVLAEDLPQLPA